MFKCIEVADAVGINRLDGYRFPIQQSLTGVGYPPRGREITIRYSEATMWDPVALRQKATSGGGPLESAQTSTAKHWVIQ